MCVSVSHLPLPQSFPRLLCSTLHSNCCHFLIAVLVLDSVLVQWDEMRHQVAATVSSMVSEVHMLSRMCSSFAGYVAPSCCVSTFFFFEQCFYHNSIGVRNWLKCTNYIIFSALKNPCSWWVAVGEGVIDAKCPLSPGDLSPPHP